MRLDVLAALSKAFRAVEKALLVASQHKPPEIDTLFANMQDDAALVETLERSRAAVVVLLNKPEKQDVKDFELAAWERFLEEKRECKDNLLHRAVGGQTPSVMTETFIEAQREARAEASLNDPAKKAERAGRNRVQARKNLGERISRGVQSRCDGGESPGWRPRAC